MNNKEETITTHIEVTTSTRLRELTLCTRQEVAAGGLAVLSAFQSWTSESSEVPVFLTEAGDAKVMTDSTP